MRAAKNRLMKIMLAFGLLGMVGIGSNAYVNAHSYATDPGGNQPLIHVNLQLPIDGSFLVPHNEFSLSNHAGPGATPAPQPRHNNAVFVYRSLEHTGGPIPSPSLRNTAGRVTLRFPGGLNKAGHVFVGWRNGNHVFQPSQIFYIADNSAHFYFYAVWAPAVSLTLNAAPGSPASQTIRRGAGTQMMALPRPTRPGYVFLGWFNTPEETGGLRLFAHTTVPNTDTTYWARWGTMTIYYQNFTNSDSPEAQAYADNSVAEIKHLFYSNFGINMVQRSEARYEPGLDPWFPPGALLNVNRSTHNTVHFRFVSFFFGLAGAARQAHGIDGTVHLHLGDMVVTTLQNPTDLRFTVVHEISHVFGAHDCRSHGCVMNHATHRALYNHWCDPCRDRMHNYLAIRWRNNPWLRN